MDNQQRYEDAVHRLNSYNYEVFLRGEGYIVRHHTDKNDLSYARHLDDLVDFADLIEWAVRRRAS